MIIIAIMIMIMIMIIIIITIIIMTVRKGRDTMFGDAGGAREKMNTMGRWCY